MQNDTFNEAENIKNNEKPQQFAQENNYSRQNLEQNLEQNYQNMEEENSQFTNKRDRNELAYYSQNYQPVYSTQSYRFDYSAYKSKIRTKDRLGFSVIIVAIILLMGLALFIGVNKTKKDYFYCVEVGDFLSYSNASILAGEIQAKGGAGYVHYDGSYHVLTSLYLTEEDAEKVVQNLIATYPNSKVFTIEVEHWRGNSKFSESENEVLSEIANANIKLIEGVYIAINRFDSSQDSLSTFALNLQDLAENYQAKADKISGILNSSSSQQTSKKYIQDIIDRASSLSSTSQTENSDYQLKYSLIKITFSHSSFIESL